MDNLAQQVYYYAILEWQMFPVTDFRNCSTTSSKFIEEILSWLVMWHVSILQDFYIVFVASTNSEALAW